MKNSTFVSKNKMTICLWMCGLMIGFGCQQNTKTNFFAQTSVSTEQPTEAYLTERNNFDSCTFSLTHEELRKQEKIIIISPMDCDSFRIYVPAGGTITNAELYTDENLTSLVAETPSFGLMETYITEDSIIEVQHTNFMTLDSKRKGTFFLSYGSCHWGSKMWIEIK